jgi:hypothetical protein
MGEACRSGAGSGGAGRKGALDQKQELICGVRGLRVAELFYFAFEKLMDRFAASAALGARRTEHVVEAAAELRVTIADEEAQPASWFPERQ